MLYPLFYEEEFHIGRYFDSRLKSPPEVRDVLSDLTHLTPENCQF